MSGWTGGWRTTRVPPSIDKVVVFAVFLAAARGAGGVGNGHADVGMVLQQPGDQRGFACAGCGGNNKNIALHGAEIF